MSKGRKDEPLARAVEVLKDINKEGTAPAMLGGLFFLAVFGVALGVGWSTVGWSPWLIAVVAGAVVLGVLAGMVGEEIGVRRLRRTIRPTLAARGVENIGTDVIAALRNDSRLIWLDAGKPGGAVWLLRALGLSFGDAHRAVAIQTKALAAHDRLRKRVAAGDSRERRDAIEALPAIGGVDALVVATELLEDGDENVRLSAVRAVGEMLGAAPDDARKAAARSLAARLADDDRYVREAAAKALRGGDMKEQLIRALSHRSPYARQLAAESLAALRWEPEDEATRDILHVASGVNGMKRVTKSEHGIAALMIAVSGDDASTHEEVTSPVKNVRREALAALGATGHPKAVDHLISFAQNPKQDKWLRRDAFEALGASGDPRAVPALLSALGGDHGGRAALSLGRLGAREAIAPIACWLNGDHHFREEAIEALALLEATEHAPQIRAALADKHERLRRAGFGALIRMGAFELGDVDMLKRDPHRLNREFVTKDLGALVGPVGTQSLLAMLADDEGRVRQIAIEQLTARGDHVLHAGEIRKAWSDIYRYPGHMHGPLERCPDCDGAVFQCHSLGNRYFHTENVTNPAACQRGYGNRHPDYDPKDPAAQRPVVIVERSVDDVWRVFTEPSTWKTWWGGDLSAVEPGWQADARLVWSGGSTATVFDFAGRQRVGIRGAYGEELTWFFARLADNRSEVRMERSVERSTLNVADQRGQDAEDLRTLTKLKALVEGAPAV